MIFLTTKRGETSVVVFCRKTILVLFAAEFSWVSYFAIPSIETASKIAAFFFPYDDHQAKVVLPGVPCHKPMKYNRLFLDAIEYKLRSVQYDRTFFDNVNYEHLLT